MGVEKSLKKIISSWFLQEPLLFGVVCNHNLLPNPNINVPMRCGKLRIEYSDSLLENCEEEKLEFYLRTEAYRILLGHPYARQPLNVKPGILLLASDVTLYQNIKNPDFLELPGVLYLKNQAVRFRTLDDPLPKKWRGSEELKFYQRNLQIDPKTGDLLLQDKLSFEQWYRKILFLVKETAVAGQNAGSDENALLENAENASELWEENQEAQNLVKDEIKKAETDSGWGGLGGEEQRAFKESADFSFDYRRALAQFRQSIVSANRTLTRMKPNRRYGLKAMGSRYERKANILIAVDVSGSITDESFMHFTHAIKNFFFLGIIENIDLIFFDVNLKNTKPVSFRAKVELKDIKGRGGTNFQPAVDYFEAHADKYSGMIIFTDGEGSVPVVKKSSKQILWILDSRSSCEKCRQWINSLSGNRCTYLPF